MKRFYTSFILLLFFSFSYGKLHIYNCKNNIQVLKEGGYVEDISVSGICTKEDDYYAIYFNTLESIDDLEVFILNDRGKWVKEKSKEFKEQDAVGNNFYSGKKQINIYFSKNKKFKISYKKNTKEIKFLASIFLGVYEQIDTLDYELNVPSNIICEFKYGKNCDEYIIKVDSSINESGIQYLFFIKDTLIEIHNYGIIYLNVHNRDISAEKDLINWLSKLCTASNGISEETYKTLIAGKKLESDTLLFVKELFENVRSIISYIDIYGGYRAWQPNKVDDIYKLRKGDCKDMANVMHQCLHKAGINSSLAVVPTLNRTDNYLFPSLYSFDHMICIAHFGNMDWVLDATDDKAFFGYPSQHTQGRTAVEIVDDRFITYEIPVIPSDSNCIIHSFNLNFDSGIKGDWKIEFFGYEASGLNYNIFNNSKNDVKLGIYNYLKILAPKYVVSEVSWEIEKNIKTTIKCKMELEYQYIINADSTMYFRNAYLPRIFEDSFSEMNGIWMNMNTQKVQCNVNMNVATNLKSVKNIDANFHNEFQKFNMISKLENKNNINTQITYVNDKLILDKDQHQEYVKFLKKMKNSISTLIEIK